MGGGIGGGGGIGKGGIGGDDCIPKTRFLSHFQESKTKKDLVEKIKSLKNTLYLITSETLENTTVVKMLKKYMLKSGNFHNVLIPCCR